MSSAISPSHNLPSEPIDTTVFSSISPLQKPADPNARLGPETDLPATSATNSSDQVQPMTTTRRFIPQPVEISTRSSRKFDVELIESSSKSNRSGEALHAGNSKMASTTTLVAAQNSHEEPASKAPRRFAPEPIETSTRSSKKKFTPQPIESSTRSSKDSPKKENDHSSATPTRRKFAPEPIETSTSSSRRRRKQQEEEEEEEEEETDTVEAKVTQDPPSRTPSGRKFSPELLETAKASYRRDPKSPISSVPDYLRPLHAPSTMPNHDHEDDPPAEESRFSAAALARKQREEKRQHTHSFAVPLLPCIDSDSSDDDISDPPSFSDSSTASSHNTEANHFSRVQTNDTTYTDYFHQSAAAKNAEKLREQAMAAYINERHHEPVDHFAIDHDDDEDEDTPTLPPGRLSSDKGIDVKTFRRDSAADLDWETENMKRHHAQLEEMKRDLMETQSRFSAAALAAKHQRAPAMNKAVKTGRAQKDSELAKMRDAASPPMLGNDIIFPFSVSPKMTRCDVDQFPRPRTADGSNSERMEGDPQLWSARVGVSTQSSGGLWGGMCHQEPVSESGIQTRPATPMRSGLQTPAPEGANPAGTLTPGLMWGGTSTPGKRLLNRPISPGGAGAGNLPMGGWLALTSPAKEHTIRDTFTESIDRKLKLEQEIDLEFPNHVVTQIYNYISLGYPSLAHKFDHELSKISRFSVDELRRDDELVDAKGYVNAPEGDGVDEDLVTGGKCKRWEALRLYCREWYRQSPQMRNCGAPDWGERVRRGSWAV